MGGQPQYAAFHGKKTDEFWTDPEIIADFKKTVEHVINRKNTYTGRLYRDEPAIFGWETGNEIDATQDWTHEIAAYIKQLDSNHLVVDGRSLHGVAAWQVEEPNTDLVTTHHYPHGPGVADFVPAIREAYAMTKGKKPYAIGEFGFTSTPEIKRVYNTVIGDGMAGALLWSLRFHNRDGGFYWHMEVGAGGNFYKAYHWPGFTSGDAYDELAVMQLTRDKGFEIQGLKPPEIVRPAPPKLLPIENPAMISWQGSVGASGYDVERADQASGPWSYVGKNVSDADAQYRALFSDASAEPKKAYYYRVAAINSAGKSDSSNVVGPVTVSSRMLVDECRDLKTLHDSAGGVAVRTTNARLTKEDGDRFALPGGRGHHVPARRTGGGLAGFRLCAQGRHRVNCGCLVRWEGIPAHSGSGEILLGRPRRLRLFGAHLVPGQRHPWRGQVFAVLATQRKRICPLGRSKAVRRQRISLPAPDFKGGNRSGNRPLTRPSALEGEKS